MPRPQMSFSDPSTWEQMFQELIWEEKPRAKWTLQLDKNILPDNFKEGWRQYQQTGHGWFQCSICNRHWISAQVKILCHMYWEPRKLQGQVLMRIFGQSCQKCSVSKFEKPEFSAESIQRILEKLASHIVQKYYGHGLKKKPSTSNEWVHLDGPHDRDNCEACTLDPRGGCAYKAKPPKSPSPPPKSHSSSPPQSRNFLSQPESTYSESMHVQEHREPNITGLLTALSIGAIILIRLIFL